MKRYIRGDRTSSYRRFHVKKVVASEQPVHDADWERRLDEFIDSKTSVYLNPDDAVSFLKEVWNFE